MIKLNIEKRSGKARTGTLSTSHGVVKTPGFVPVGTRGALKGMSFEDASALGADIFMVNTFHFYCKKEYEIVGEVGGLHRFLDINYPLMTDSGGFQVFSLGAGWERGVGKLKKEESKQTKRGMVKINEEGVVFRSPFDGSRVEMTPESSMEAQMKLGADIVFAFDECTSPLASKKYQEQSLQRTHRWAERCIKSFKSENQGLFGIVQGSGFEDLRRESAKVISSLPFSGFGIGGSFGGSFGDSKQNMYDMVEIVCNELPENKPRHLLGIGDPDDILEGALRGIDLFDCVTPTRFARHGTALTHKGRLNLRSSQLKNDDGPIDEECSCDVCKKYKRRYIHHLTKKKEIYGIMILMHHNIHFMMSLMENVRKAIEEDNLPQFKEHFLNKYKSK